MWSVNNTVCTYDFNFSYLRMYVPVDQVLRVRQSNTNKFYFLHHMMIETFQYKFFFQKFNYPWACKILTCPQRKSPLPQASDNGICRHSDNEAMLNPPHTVIFSGVGLVCRGCTAKFSESTPTHRIPGSTEFSVYQMLSHNVITKCEQKIWTENIKQMLSKNVIKNCHHMLTLSQNVITTFFFYIRSLYIPI